MDKKMAFKYLKKARKLGSKDAYIDIHRIDLVSIRIRKFFTFLVSIISFIIIMTALHVGFSLLFGGGERMQFVRFADILKIKSSILTILSLLAVYCVIGLVNYTYILLLRHGTPSINEFNAAVNANSPAMTKEYWSFKLFIGPCLIYFAVVLLLDPIFHVNFFFYGFKGVNIVTAFFIACIIYNLSYFTRIIVMMIFGTETEKDMVMEHMVDNI